MDAALNQFYQHLGVERGLAPLTVAAYARDLLDFWEFLEGTGRSHWGAVALADLQDYFAALEARGLSAPQPGPAVERPAAIFPLPEREEQVIAIPRVAGLAAPAPALPQVLGEAGSGGAALCPGPWHPGGPQGPGPSGGLCHGP
jgi:hypothetical protein